MLHSLLLRRRFWLLAFLAVWLLPQAVKLCGENQIVYASDFPHWDHSFPGSIGEIKERGDITDAQKRKILADNTRRLYGLKP